MKYQEGSIFYEIDTMRIKVVIKTKLCLISRKINKF